MFIAPQAGGYNALQNTVLERILNIHMIGSTVLTGATTTSNRAAIYCMIDLNISHEHEFTCNILKFQNVSINRNMADLLKLPYVG